MGFLYFLLAVLLWEVIAVIVLNQSLTGFFAAAFFTSLWALPIVGFVSVAYAFSQPFRMGLLLFLGLCAVGAAGMLVWLSSLPTWYTAKQDGTLRFILFPTLAVIVLYSARFFSSAIRSGE